MKPPIHPALSPEEDMMIAEWCKIYHPHNPYDPNKSLSNFNVTAMVKMFIERVSKKVRIKQKNKPKKSPTGGYFDEGNIRDD